MTTKTELSPSGRKVLQAAYQHNGFLFADSGGLKGGPAIQVRKSLIAAGLVEDAPFTGQGDAFPDRCGLALRITDAGKTALGAQEPATQGPEGAAASVAAPKPASPRHNTKQAQLVGMLQRPAGASIAQVCDAFGWQAHTARAAISTLPRKAGCAKPISTMEGRERIYKLPAVGGVVTERPPLIGERPSESVVRKPSQ